MDFSMTNEFFSNHSDFINASMMGPNAMRVSEEMAAHLDLQPGMRVLDLGCGLGLSTLLLVKKYGVQVTAADLWIDPTGNLRMFREFGIDSQVMPLRLDATRELPFAGGYFDLVFSVDAYHYFGASEGILPALAHCVRKGGVIAVAVPGLQRDLPGGYPDGYPPALRPFLPENPHFYSPTWWRAHWEQCAAVRVLESREMDCHAEAWREWLASPNPYAVRDVDMMAAEGGRYYNHVMITAEVL